MELVHNNDIEHEILSIMLNQPKTIPYVSKKLTVSMFYMEDNQTMYRGLIHLYNTKGEAIDSLMLIDTIGKMFPQYIKSIPFIVSNIINGGFSTDKIDWYIERIVEYASRRKLSKMAEYTRQNANDLSVEIREILTKLQSGVDLIQNTVKEEVDLAQDIEDMTAAIGQKKNVIPFGIPVLDRKIAGYMRHDITTIGGRTSHGKTTFVIDSVRRIADLGFTVNVITNEVPKMLYLQKLACNISNLEYQRIIKYGDVQEEDVAKIKEAKEYMLKNYIGKLKIYEYVDNINSICSLILANKPQLFILDWLQRIPLVPGVIDGKEWIKISYSEIARAVAKTGTAAIVVSQLSTRKAQMRSNKRPELFDFDDCSFIEKVSCDCHLLYWYYHDTRVREFITITELINAKNRFGEPSVSLLHYDPKSGRYEDTSMIPREKAQNYIKETGLLHG
jgi:replicative DNA helicase